MVGSQGATGAQGAAGAAGRTGRDRRHGSAGCRGTTGNRRGAGLPGGSSGSTGPSGISGTFESSGAVALTTTITGAAGNVGLLPPNGALASAPVSVITGGAIINTDSTDNWVGQVVPGNETITGVSASFNVNEAIDILVGFVAVQVQVWVSSNGGLTYSPILAIPMTPFSGIVAVGTVSTGSATGLSEVIPKGDLAMVVLSANGSGASLLTTLTGSGTVGLSYTSG